MRHAARHATDPRPAVDDCWNRIGVRGDLSCPELERHVHCRNCPVHASAAEALLDGDPPAGYLAFWTGQIAQEKAVRHIDTRSVLVFRIGMEWLALPAPVFNEVAELRAIHSLPHQRSGVVQGLVNVRGELLVCVSLGRLLGLGQTAASGRTQKRLVHPRLLVIGQESQRLVFPVDEVHGIHRYRPEELTVVPDTVAKATAYTRAMLPWQDRTVGCLDEQLLFDTLHRSLS